MHSDDVLAYLEHHPDFLQRHAERFGLSQPVASQDRVVVSLADRQLLDARDRNRQLEARLQQLMRHGEVNDRINAQTHQLALGLMAAHTPQQALAALQRCFGQDFSLDRVALRLWHPKAENWNEIHDGRHEVLSLARNLSTPYCGPYVNDEVLSWFPAMPVLQSFVQLTLRDEHNQPFGLLVLASDDGQRFTQDMQTHYLAQIGELISVALLRTLEMA